MKTVDSLLARIVKDSSKPSSVPRRERTAIKELLHTYNYATECRLRAPNISLGRPIGRSSGRAPNTHR